MTDKTENKEEKLKEEIENYKETIDILHRNIDELEAGKQEQIEKVKEAVKKLKDSEIEFLDEFDKKSKKEMIKIICKRYIELKNKKDRIDKIFGDKLSGKIK